MLCSQIVSYVDSSVADRILKSDPRFNSSRGGCYKFETVTQTVTAHFYVPPLVSPKGLSLTSVEFAHSGRGVTQQIQSHEMSLLGVFDKGVALSDAIVRSGDTTL